MYGSSEGLQQAGEAGWQEDREIQQEFSKRKCKALHLAGITPCSSSCWGLSGLKKQHGRRIMQQPPPHTHQILVEKLTVSQQYTSWQSKPTACWAASGRQLPAGEGKRSFPCLISGKQSVLSSSGLPSTRGMGTAEQAQQWDKMTDQELEHVVRGEEERAGTVHLEK